MKTIQRTALFDRWLRRLRDGKAVNKIETRITRLRLGDPGDHKYLGGGLAEMLIDYGPGCRLYWAEQGSNVILLLCGGDKASQADDITKARAMIDMIEEL